MATSLVSTLTSTRPGSLVNRGMAGALAIVAAAVCGSAVAFVVHWAPGSQAVTRGMVELVVVGVPLGAGLYGIRSLGSARFGLILIATGFAWSVTALAESPESLAYSIGRVAAWLVFPGLIQLMLTFPDGRAPPGPDRMLYRALNLVLVLLFVGSALFVEAYPTQTPWATCRLHCPPNAFLVLDHEPAVMRDVVQPVREALAVLLFAGVGASMAARWRSATPLRRRTIGPVMVANAVSIALLAAFFTVRHSAPHGRAAEMLGLLWSLSVAGVAGAFLVALLQRRLLVGQVVARLGGTLNGEVDPPHLRAGLAAAVSDPTLEVLMPVGPARWRDTEGHATGGLPVAVDGRAVTVIRDNGLPVVALVHDAELRADDELLAAVESLVVAGLRSHRLKTRLAGSLAQLERSRRRIARSADLERSRIERDLHDGAQQRLITLRMRVSFVEDLLRSDPDAGAAAVGALGEEVERTLEELRSLAHGVYPATLSDRGIVDALRSVGLEASLPVHLQAHGVSRHSTEVETAVYFTCVEALQNAVKHAKGATAVWIVVRQGAALAFEVRDDGPGFVPLDTDAAEPGGLRNMRDRLEAVGGSLTVESSPGNGTRMIGVVPLG